MRSFYVGVRVKKRANYALLGIIHHARAFCETAPAAFELSTTTALFVTISTEAEIAELKRATQ